MSEPVAVREGLFEEDASGTPHLLGARCRACGRSHFPRTATCPYCGSTDVEPTTLSDLATLWGWTAVTAAPPGYHGPVPFGFGIVELPEGLRVITRLEEPDPVRLSFGMPMRLVLVDLDDEHGNPVRTYAFAPAGAR